jgi:hypothetical protein
MSMSYERSAIRLTLVVLVVSTLLDACASMNCNIQGATGSGGIGSSGAGISSAAAVGAAVKPLDEPGVGEREVRGGCGVKQGFSTF